MRPAVSLKGILQKQILENYDRFGGVVSDIAKELGKAYPTVHKSFRSLVKSGYIDQTHRAINTDYTYMYKGEELAIAVNERALFERRAETLKEILGSSDTVNLQSIILAYKYLASNSVEMKDSDKKNILDSLTRIYEKFSDELKNDRMIISKLSKEDLLNKTKDILKEIAGETYLAKAWDKIIEDAKTDGTELDIKC